MATLMTGGLASEDRLTHVERINPGDNPAYVPGSDGHSRNIVSPRVGEERLPYRTTELSINAAGARVPSGSVVWLYKHETGGYHELAPELMRRKMTDEQFAQLMALLREMLTPGYEISKMMLAEKREQEAAHRQYEADQAAAEAAKKAAAKPKPVEGAPTA